MIQFQGPDSWFQKLDAGVQTDRFQGSAFVHVLFPSIFSELQIRVLEGHFYCVHRIRFLEPTKIGSCE